MTQTKNIASTQNGTPLSKNQASGEAVTLMDFLRENYGKKIISGQMDLAWKDEIDQADFIYRDTGKYPALMGYDFMNMQFPRGSGRKQVEEAIAWAKGKYNYQMSYKGHKGGIVTFCWHWYMPSSPDFSDRRWGFYVNREGHGNTEFRIPYNPETNSLDKSTWEFDFILKNLDFVSSELQKLKEEKIPVLWRPLHEASGGWFWWGAGDKNSEHRAECFLALWKFMVEYFTEEKKLDNLIWVWNGQDADWYPGDNYADIIGEDIYATTPEHQDFGSQKERFEKAKSYTAVEKIIALSENGTIPKVGEMIKDGFMWSYFMTWNDGRFTDGKPTGDDGNFWSGELHNPLAHRRSIYNDKRVITLEDLC